jgi:phosphoadenosine phosphosulfate reductase
MVNESLKIHAATLLHQFSRVNDQSAMRLLIKEFPNRIIFSTGLSEEYQVIKHLILQKLNPVSIFTLDTGRPFAETSTNQKYRVKIKVYYPDRKLMQGHVNAKRSNAFYESVANRMKCRTILKVDPLKRVLAGKAVWATDLRAEHYLKRESATTIEWDEPNYIIKYNSITASEALSSILAYSCMYDQIIRQN